MVRSLSMGQSSSGRRRRTVLSLLVVVGVVAGLLVLRQPAPVGHFTSAAAADRYRAAYASAMAAPDAVLDVRTSFGVVRAYRFAGARPGAEPLVLLPGTMSGAPVFADNLRSMRA